MAAELNTTFSVAGKGVAELPIPGWLRLMRLVISVAVAAAVLAVAFVASGWTWVTEAGADGMSAGFALWSACVVTSAIAAPLVLSRAGALDRLLGIRRGRGGARVFGGFRSPVLGPFRVLSSAAALVAITAAATFESVRTCPLPEVLTRVRITAEPPLLQSTTARPVFFWDYSTWIDPAWLDAVNLVIPYEKGPPAKLLPKIFFEDARTHRIVLELHGKRPRTYSPEEVHAAFNAPVVQPHDWPLLFRLEREAGLIAGGISAPILYLMRIGQTGTSRVTQAIGVPWEASDSQPHPESGHVFFWGPDGAVFQVKCPSPCPAGRLLELVQFPADPRGSLRERLEWTKSTLKNLLTRIESDTPEARAARARDEKLVSLYLVSLLTLDPRDPEAFFHLGKLARNRLTLTSAIRYGRDLGLEHVKLLELESLQDKEFGAER